MIKERIPLTGIRPRENSIGPPGHHLRWTFPENLGFPKGFVIYRRPSGAFKPNHCLNLNKAAVPTGQTLASGSSLEGVSFVYPVNTRIYGNGENLTISPPTQNLLELRFPAPMAYLRLKMAGVRGPISLQAYAGPHLVATSAPLSDPTGFLEIAVSYITSVTIPLNFETLVEVCYLSMEAVCKDGSWQIVTKLPLVTSLAEALSRLETGLRNRYATNRARAVQRYQPELETLVKWLKLLQDPTSSVFANPGASPDRLQLPSPEEDSPLSFIHPQAMLLLASLDPNIARFLSLYWVDAYGAPNGPQARTVYDYKVEGQWLDQEVGCGLVFGLGAGEARLPFVGRPLVGNQLPGLRWQGRNPRGRVGLRWPRPKEGQGAVQPVLFDLWRNFGGNGSAFLTEKLPVLVPAAAWENDGKALFVDTDVPLGKHSYRLQAIDLFGQVGEAIDSEPVPVKDLEAPPPPVRLRAFLSQPGYPWRTPESLGRIPEPATLDLQFEYGDAQYRQAPDAKEFRLHWRAASLFENRPVTVQRLASQSLADNRKVYTVRVPDSAGLDLNSFAGGKLSRQSPTASPLPAGERHHYHIAEHLPPDQLRLAPTENDFADGQYRLVSDPRLRSNWQTLAQTVPVRPPMQGLVQAAGFLQAKATRVSTLTPGPDPLARLPAGRRPAVLAEPPPYVEVELDRRLLEPGLFAGGTVVAGGISYPIIYSTGSHTAPARLGLPAETDISSGALLTLRPAPSFTANIRRIESLPAGGLAITLPAPGNPAGTDFLIGGLVTIAGHHHTILQAWDQEIGLRLHLRPLDRLPAAVSSWLNQEVQVTPPLVQALTIQCPAPAEVAKVPGGEIAFEVIRDGQPITYVARVVSDLVVGSGAFNLLVRLSRAAGAALQPSTTVCRYYAPYRQHLQVTLPTTNGSTDPAGTVALPLSPDQSSQNLYLAVNARDERANQGPLSSPVQVMAVKPPPSGAPGRPYPCNQPADVVAGYATPPDRQGRATLCLTWDAGTLSTTEGLRYEVARALDNTIVATHRRNWLLGRAMVAPPLTAGPQVNGTLSNVSFDQARGLYRVSMAVNLGANEPSVFRGGRLSRNGHHFQVTAVAAEASGALDLVLRTDGQEAPDNGPATLTALPNYDQVRQDAAALSLLAADNPDAFSLVTGVPINTTQFRDEIPGLGRNRFFYRVRAVDAAENRSAWSEVSAPFYQVETTPPDAVRHLQAFAADRLVRLMWAATSDPAVMAYQVTRIAPFDSGAPAVPVTLGATHTQRPLRLYHGKLQLRLPVSPQSTPTVIRLNAPLAISLFINNDGLTVLSGRQVQQVNKLVPDGTSVVIVFRRGNSTYAVDRRPGTGESLALTDGSVDLSFGFNLQSVVGVFLRQAYLNGEAGLNLNNWFAPGVTVANLTVTGLSPVLADGTEVVVLTRDVDGQNRVITSAPGTREPLTVQGGSIALDLDLANVELEDVVVTWTSSGPQSAMVRIPSRFVFSEQTRLAQFFDLNPLAGEGTPVLVNWIDSHGTVHLESTVFGEFEFEDVTARAGRKYRYDVTAEKSVLLNPAKTAKITSPPASIHGIHCPESNTPEITSLDVSWLTASGTAARHAGEARLVRINFTSGACSTAMLLRLAADGTTETSSPWTEPSEYDARTDLFRFELQDEADPVQSPRYVVRLVSCNGRQTESEALAPRYAL